MKLKAMLLLPFLGAACAFGKPTDYPSAGEAILDKILGKFRNAGQGGLYAEKIDAAGNIVTDNNGVSFVWPASHLLRALRWGFKENPDKYRTAFHDFVFSVYRYKSSGSGGAGRQGYAVLPGSVDRFYDDNAVMNVEMALAYAELREAPVLADARMAYDFCSLDHDADWGIPQKPEELGQGKFYSMAVSPVGHGAAILHRLSGDAILLTDAVQFYRHVNDSTNLLKDTVTGLFNQFTFKVNGTWSYTKSVGGILLNGQGQRAYQTTYVLRQALELYAATHEAHYRTDAEAMMKACLKAFYAPGKGLREDAFWGGDDMVDALEDLYEATGDLAWHAYAKDIVGFLVTYGKDSQGWYPSDEDDAKGDWNLDRRQVLPGTIFIMGQSAAAAAILRVAFHEAHPTVAILPSAPGSRLRRRREGRDYLLDGRVRDSGRANQDDARDAWLPGINRLW